MGKKYSIVVLLALSLLFTYCKKSEDVTEPEEVGTESVIQVINSTSGGSATTPSGYGISVIQGSVPPNQQGSSANVTFSIESPSTPPKPIPSSATAKSDIIRVGPEGFAFRWPIKLKIPYKDAEADQIKVLFFDPVQDNWRIVPASKIDNASKIVEVDVLNLGYFAAATVTSNFPNKINASDSDGGFEYGGEAGYYYTLTVKSVSNFKYPYQAAWYGSSIVGASGSSGSGPTGGPLSPTRVHLSQATYEIWISRTQPGTLSQLPKLYTYTIPATGTISQPVTYSGVLSTGQGWTPLYLPGGGTWREGSPDNWPAPTSTYGTGQFQATLNWVNNSSKRSDIDLHLFGPNNMHVYYGSSKSSDGSLELDRDWMEELGNAVENIYSLSSLPKGDYIIRVNLYSGNPNSYSVRIIRGGSVKTYTGSLSTTNSADNTDKMITIDSFKIQ